MKAVLYEQFNVAPTIKNVPDPTPEPHSVVVKVMATGLCRSDWHGWRGHDKDITLPHVPGHELAGIIETVGKDVTRWRVGDRVTVPFVGGCGACGQCFSGNHQICDNQFQPGFTHWGSFAEYVSLHYADVNLVALPQTIDFATAASLGCRFATSFRAVMDQGKCQAGQWVCIFGCGGVGLSAIMIARAAGAHVIAVDVGQQPLKLAKTLGADIIINSHNHEDVVGAIHEASKDGMDEGVHLSIDAIGHKDVCLTGIKSLRKRGKHVQVGLMVEEGGLAAVPMDLIIANELEILGSHGMQSFRYQDMLNMISTDRLKPQKLIGKKISLEESIEALMTMDQSPPLGVTIIDKF